jgi:small subunit ribosomal protein S20
MPNIKQQKKRVRSAARQRVENLRYRSAAKTLAKRFRDAAAEGGAEAEYKALVSWLDRAAARGAIHRNTAARRKAQAAKLLARKSA